MFLEEKREGEYTTLAPTLCNLIYSLRHQETWPKGFRWNFNSCRRCAMGLAFALWPQTIAYAGFGQMFEAFPEVKRQRHGASRIFFRGQSTLGGWWFLTKPHHIADALEKLL